MKYMIKMVFFLSVMFIANSGCAEHMMTSGKVEKLFNETLAVGDSESKIENFLKDHDIAFSYDDFMRRYQCIIRDPSPRKPKGYHSIVIHIYVDADRNFQRAEVRDSYTGL
ncbi:hypothetical protein CWE08_07705 [Aliidiomarina iranensis]|uniref:Uncharacterized protein n=1 Tax=Aliidiomarina iranensis TaxID=1434071 RepID=A0A432VWN6_9GAMM|nr:hypothetical protein [Aliidiomarina iranensis]RUO20978.1 hypothetical protein CWE08_07705 [Aliidiomarina iranensis]